MITLSPDSDIAAPEILDALARIEGSKLFANSKRLTELLRFVVEASLRGETEGLKQTAIGTELYQRDPSYDPKVDGIVRTHARRLRERLREYYRSEGTEDPVKIDVPRGGYVPTFHRQNGSAVEASDVGGPYGWLPGEENLDFDLVEAEDGSSAPAKADSSALARLHEKLAAVHHEIGRMHFLGVPLLILIPVVVAALALAGVLLWRRAGEIGRSAGAAAHQRLPRVAVLHFRAAARGTESELFGRALADSVVASLARMNEISVVEPPESSSGPPADGSDAEIAAQLKADYVVTGRFEKTKKLSRLSVTLMRSDGGPTVVWHRDYSFPWANVVEIEDSMAAALSQSLAQRVKAAN